MTGKLLQRRGPTLTTGLLLVLACGTPVPTDVQDDLSSAKAAPAPLTVSSTSPGESPRDTTLDVRILGTGYDRSAQATFLLDGQADARVRTNSTKYVSETEVIANLTIAADAVPDRYDVQVALTGGKKGIGTELFAVQAILALNAGQESQAHGVTSQGVVVGTSRRAGPCGTLAAPFVWSQASGLLQLPLPDGACAASALAINESNVIVGWMNGAVGVRWLPDGAGNWTVERLGFLSDGSPISEAIDVDDEGTVLIVTGAVWSPSLGYRALTTPAGASDCITNGRSEDGQIAGSCIINSRNRALLWTNESAQPLALPDLAGAISTVAHEVNSSGVVVGTVTGGPKRTKEYHAVRWVPAPDGSYTIEALGSLGAGNAWAFGINDAGQIVGRSVVSGTNYNAFLWQPGEGMRDLGSIKLYGSTANDISEPDALGQVAIVGYSNAGATRWLQ